MPYIEQADREKIKATMHPESAGELNYAIHILLERYLIQKGEGYQTYNDMQGALRCVADELARRRVAQWEDKKIKLNGDISFYRDI